MRRLLVIAASVVVFVGAMNLVAVAAAVAPWLALVVAPVVVVGSVFVGDCALRRWA